MEAIGKIYRLIDATHEEYYQELDFLERMLKDEGFRTVRSGSERKITICDGGDILNYQQHRVGFIDKDYVYALNKKLEDFMDDYESI